MTNASVFLFRLVSFSALGISAFAHLIGVDAEGEGRVQLSQRLHLEPGISLLAGLSGEKVYSTRAHTHTHRDTHRDTRTLPPHGPVSEHITPNKP